MKLFPVGRCAVRTTVVTAEQVDRFIALSNDTSPLHVDPAFARAHHFKGRLVHGQLLGALVSGVIGTELPGAAGVLQEIKLAFHNPCYLGDEVRVMVTVAEQHMSLRVLVCKVEVRNGDGLLLVKGHCRSGILDSQ
jgi:3-hydroxybutyryl-CoA dehydratase